MKQHFTSIISQKFGQFASKPFPPAIQRIINAGYVRIMGLDMHEFHPSSTYRTLNDLFTRRLHTPRDFSIDAEDFISPCDSLITAAGSMDKDLALQIKGMEYSVEGLLGQHITSENIKRLENGSYANFYLSPRDYHRYHAPANLKVLKAVHIPGKLYPVNMPSLKKQLNLFIENERVVLECETQHHQLIYIVLVGALNVGKMQLSFEPKIKTNVSQTASQHFTYEDLYINKGEDFGCFEMGSTIVILAEKGVLDYSLEAGQHVRFGETIATLH